MKQTYLLFAAALCLLGGDAAARGIDPRTGTYERPAAGTALSAYHYAAARMTPISPVAASATGSTSSRLIGSSSYRETGAGFNITDSARYSFSGSRGGDLNSAYIHFDQLLRLHSSSSTGLENEEQVTQTFDAYGNVSTRLSQSWDRGLGAWGNRSHYLFTYDGSGHILTSIQLGWNTSSSAWDSVQRTVNTYTATGELSSSTNLSFNIISGMFENRWRVLLSYDASGHLTAETYQNWNSITAAWVNDVRSVYTYASGLRSRMESQTWNIISNTWNDAYRSDYSYNASGKLELELDQQFILLSAIFRNTFRIHFSYDASGNLSRDRSEEWDIAGALWQDRERTDRIFDGSGNLVLALDLDYNLVRNSWDSVRQTDFTYNSSNQATSISETNLDPGSSTANTRNNYYYDDLATIISQSGSPDGRMLLYPVPAANELYLDIDWANVQDFTVVITDLQGRIWQQWSEAAASKVTRKVAVGNFPAGSYFVQVYGLAGAHTSKQLLVSH